MTARSLLRAELWRSLPVRLSLTVAGLLVVTVALALTASFQLAVDAMEAQSDRAARALLVSFSASHAGELLAMRPEDVAEMQRAAQRLVTDDSTGIRSVVFHGVGGQVVASSHASELPAPLARAVPHDVEVDTPGPGLKSFCGPIHFGGREVGALALILRDDLALRLAPRMTSLHLRLGLAAAFFGVVLVLLLTRRALRPIPALASALDRVREADFSARVPETGPHEFRRLAGAFNEMSKRLALFSQYTHPAIVRALIQDPELAAPGGVLRHVTVVFCDMRGFTRMSAARAPADVLRQVNLYFRLYERVFVEHGGHVDKYMGDAVMAVFGLFDDPLPDLHHRLGAGEPIPYSQRAVRAMVRARDAIRVLNLFLAQTEAETDLRLGLSPQIFGCGIASGYVTAGNLGGETRKDYSVVGSIVNLAARLESQSLTGEVLIDGHTRRNLGQGASLRPRPPVELKGLEKPVTAYEVLRLADEEDTREYLRGLFNEAFVLAAVFQGNAMATTVEVRRCTARLRALVDAQASLIAPSGPRTDGT